MVTYFRCWSALSRSNRAEAKSPDEILLDGRPDGVAPSELLATHPALRALAAAELPEVPLRIWVFMDGVLSGRHSGDARTRIAEQLGGVLLVREDGDGTPMVRLASDTLARLLRQVKPITAAERLAVTEALLAEALRTASECGRSTDRGVRPPRARRPCGALRRVAAPHRRTTGAGGDRRPCFTAASHQARPARRSSGRGRRCRRHYLQCDGVAPDAHGEWLAWLHCRNRP